jgi:hypothetical protein
MTCWDTTLTKTTLLCLFASVLVIGAVVAVQPSHSPESVQKNLMVIDQGSGIIWNGTDFNTTLTQQVPNLNATISPRTVIEYADSVPQLGVNAPLGLNTTGITPRIIFEYADYATYSYTTMERYSGITLGMTIGSPVENPPDGVPLNTSKTISFNVTSSLGLIKEIILSFETTLNQTWQPYILIYMEVDNVTFATADIVIPGQSQSCNVIYKVEAYSYPYTIDNVTNSQGDYVTNDNAGQYYIYHVVPEFPSTLILTLLVLATLFAAIAYKRAHANNRNSLTILR